MNLDKLLNGYNQWLTDNTKSRVENGWTIITTPFLDRSNDMIEILVEKTDTGIKLTDMGWTIDVLGMSSIDIKDDRNKRAVIEILNGFHIQLDNEYVIFDNCSNNTDEFSIALHHMTQAIILVSHQNYANISS